MKKILFLLSTLVMTSQVQAFSFTNHKTKAYDCDTCSQLSQDTLEDKWSITDDLSFTPVSNLQQSYRYQEEINAKQLQQGVKIYTQAPGAIIRISSQNNKELPLLVLKTSTHEIIRLKDAAQEYGDNESFDGSLGMKQKQLILQLKSELGAGAFIIQQESVGLANADNYILSIFDKNSTLHLDLESKALHYQYGERLKTRLTISDESKPDSIDDISVVLKGPQDQVIPLKVKQVKQQVYEASTKLRSMINSKGENWYIEANVVVQSNQMFFKRSVKTAFSYSIPSAHIASIQQVKSNPLTFKATVDVKTASRYAFQSAIFNNDKKAVEMIQKAQWLEPGRHAIQFAFDNSSQLSEDTLYLGYLSLMDYGQYKPVCKHNELIKLKQLAE